MSLSYAGASLVLPTPELYAWIEAAISPSWICEWTARTWPGYQMEGLPWRGYQPTGPVKLGVLSWPVGAARWAYGHYLASEDNVAAIRTACFSAGWSDAVLAISDGPRSIAPRMYCLPPRPLARSNRSTPALWLLTLVDARYLWWYSNVSIDFTLDSTTWDDLYTQLASGLGISLITDTVNAAYLKPGEAFNRSGRPAPLLLDAVASCVGQRIVRRLDGTVLAMGPATSLTALTANLGREGQTLTPPPNTRIAGHEFDFV